MQKLILWETAPLDRGPARVIIKRDMICAPLGFLPRPVAVGEEITISAATLDQLSSDDVEFIGPAPDELAFDI
jgi:hypothetical protein